MIRNAPRGPWRLARAAGVDGNGLVASSERLIDWPLPTGLLQDARAPARNVGLAAWPAFRRLDRSTAILALVVEALGPWDVLPAESRRSTAIVLGTSDGCLDTDLLFEASRRTPSGPQPRLFAYTLPSTGLGDLARRHGLTGPSLCLSVPRGGEGAVLVEAVRLIDSGDACAALVLLGNWPTPEVVRATGCTSPPAVFAGLLLPGLAHMDDALAWDDLLVHNGEPGALVALLRRRHA